MDLRVQAIGTPLEASPEHRLDQDQGDRLRLSGRRGAEHFAEPIQGNLRRAISASEQIHSDLIEVR
ncbi:hypothetical protein MES5069_520071 [Mesorhizobium escarrei]|uniref:Uncharacterized protein n=1 Tax=Mesorhizobium escarrei TaxID=666018 RepID=A0ABN8K7V3_9HYPH|nr:hypothetical protein MES5069_520071 [Mesorhizobium escarrei]